jgi:hypothetical protein
MEELIEYRPRMLAKLTEAGSQVETVVRNTRDVYQPLEKDGWNTHQVIAHMRDVNQQVYLPRLRRIVAEDDPVFENFDGEAWMASHYQPQEPILEMTAAFAGQCRSSAVWLAGLPLEAWNRPGSHPLIGKHTLQWWTERTLAHISEHLAQLDKKESKK